ncbi:MAG: GNAT family N-acetyltransferase [Methanomassiliicoccales archaeon]|nr:GNAT family N-acetyltransferase [Methanomassiliicoccales archaeon]
MVDVHLVPMTKEDFEVMRGASIKRYAEENVKVGYWTPDEALQRSIDAHEHLLSNGLKTEGHHLFKALDQEKEKVVGHIWIKVEPGEERRGFIYDVFIAEEHRDKGYGRAMMLALEAKAKRMKLDSLALHMFAYNKVAQHLYESLGYELKSVNMMKRL